MEKSFRLVLIVIAVFFTTETRSQNHERKKLVQKISYGIITTIGVANEKPEDKEERELKFERSISPFIGLKTPATEHVIMYDLLSNTFITLNAVLLPHKWDTYCAYLKNFYDGSQYVGIGIERKILKFEKEKIGGIEFFAFGEVGTTHRNAKYSFGILMNANRVLFKREGAH